MRCSLLLIGCLAPLFMAGQDLLIRGIVRAQETRAPIAQAEVVLALDSVHVATVRTDSLGYYTFTVDLDKVIQVEYRAKGRRSKNILIDTRGIPAERAAGGYGMTVDVQLFVPKPGVDVTFLDEPIGLAAYNAPDSIMAWDLDYTAARMARLKALMPELYPPDTSGVSK